MLYIFAYIFIKFIVIYIIEYIADVFISNIMELYILEFYIKLRRWKLYNNNNFWFNLKIHVCNINF